jgi:hypothetical protein
MREWKIRSLRLHEVSDVANCLVKTAARARPHAPSSDRFALAGMSDARNMNGGCSCERDIGPSIGIAVMTVAAAVARPIWFQYRAGTVFLPESRAIARSIPTDQKERITPRFNRRITAYATNLDGTDICEASGRQRERNESAFSPTTP